MPRHRAQQAVTDWGGINAAAEALGVSRWTITRALSREDAPVSSDIESVEEIISRKSAEYSKRKELYDAQRERLVQVRTHGPVGILHMGDPHVDDPGCDWPLLQQHVELVKKHGLYCATVGDMQNNWVGRLARLYAQQSTTTTESWRLTEWLIKEVPWLYIVRGNHDAWTGDGDPLSWIIRDAEVKVDAAHDAKFRLRFPKGADVLVWARHDFPGRSQWAKTHGQAKAAQMGAYSADIVISGHRHTWESRATERPDGTVYHAIQVGSYKTMDAYADQLGYPQTRHGSAVLTVIQPRSTPTGRVQVFWDIAAGVDYLTWARRKWA